jgi:hypothetical protein
VSGSGATTVVAASAPRVDLGAGSLLQAIACGLAGQLALAFPPRQFDFQLVTGPVTKAVMQRLTRRLPALALAWLGVVPDRENGRVFYGTSRWTLLLITQNEGGPQARLFSDALAPGLFAMVDAASIALQGFEISAPAGDGAAATTPWCAEGAVIVTDIENVAAEGWEDGGLATATLGISVRFAADFAPGAAWQADSFDTLGIAWDFGSTPDDFADTWTAPGPNAGSSA